MKYLPTINLDDYANHEALRLGQLKLQTGQWIKIDKTSKPSRFVVRKEGGSIWAVHPWGEKGITNKRFSETCKAWLGKRVKPVKK